MFIVAAARYGSFLVLQNRFILCHSRRLVNTPLSHGSALPSTLDAARVRLDFEQAARHHQGVSSQDDRSTVQDETRPPRSRSTSREQSVERILDAAIEVIGRRGVDKLSLTDVCQQAGVSRTTLYRHFRTKELLLEAYFSRETDRFERSMLEAVSATPEVDRRLRAVSEFRASAEGMLQSVRLLEVEPGFVLNFLRRLQPHHQAILEQALAPVFDEAERRGIEIDREMVADLLVRVQMSMYLLPARPGAKTPIEALVDLVESLPDWPKRAERDAARASVG